MADTGHLLLTTFERDGSPVSAAVRGVIAGGRAYVGAWSNSGSARRLQYADVVQVTQCGPRGFCVYGEPLDATARLLSGEEASRAAERLAIERPVQRRFLLPFPFPLPHRTRGRQMVHYELLVSDASGSLSGSHENRDVVRVHCAQTRVTAYGAASIECIWPASRPAHSSGRHMAGIAHP
jgi:PPOX class probable F420-dependent enzyme